MTKNCSLILSILLSVLFWTATVKTQSTYQVLFSVLLGVSLSVMAAFIVIEPVQSAVEKNRWEKSKKIIYPVLSSQIESLIQEMQINLHNYVSGHLLGSRNFIEILEDMSKKIKTADTSSNDFSDAFSLLFRHSDFQWSISEIRKVILPRLLLLSPDSKLTEKSIRFEANYTSLMNSIITHERVTTGISQEKILCFITAIKDLYKHLNNEQEK